MPHYKVAFPSRFLSASEIEAPYDAVIKSVGFENVGTEEKPEKKLVALFEDAGHKAIVLNVTRCEALAEIAHSTDYERWAGTRVNISQGQTRFNNKKVPTIVIGEPELPF